jgi:hypothetical protein
LVTPVTLTFPADDAQFRDLVEGLVPEAVEPAEEDAEWLRQSLRRHGNGFSTFRLLRTDGIDLEIEYHSVVYARGETVLYETALREFSPERPARQDPLQPARSAN